MCDPHSDLQALAIKSQEVILTCISGLLIKKYAKYYLHTPDIAIKWLIIKYSNLPYWYTCFFKKLLLRKKLQIWQDNRMISAFLFLLALFKD